MSAQRKRGRPRQEIRNGRKWCAYHKAWELVDQFDVNPAGNCLPSCRVARMAMADAQRDLEETPDFCDTGTGIDPDLDALAWKFVGDRASEVVKRLRYLGITVTRNWVLTELNYQSLIAPVRALIGPDGLCMCCGEPFTRQHRISVDHIEPPRWDGTVDWERLHAANTQLMHFGENGSKNDKPFAVFLHDNMQRWMAERRWAHHAGEDGWPTLEVMRLPPPEPELEPESELEPTSYQTTIFDFLVS